ncbi:drug/metabolite transporter (DMT)-like permease [Melghirimyces profundicolus]|uniref:Drug/metabolite transporter (DMT)-like permease n=1 Tax=Melghirimyces profundicolus TaxID=1242148 RepID=A0A2T6BTH8_9BACL|nr:DMT family transporter [Melghirimyces profundicolus]PTX59364.1 drug/metabolite transporter (DMT)-like permease [Melghirimyces profundicolus]
MQPKPFWADGALLCIAFVWGSTFVLVQGAIATLPPFAFLAIRFGLACITLWLVLGWRGQLRDALESRYLKAGTFLGLWLFMGYALQTFSLLYTTSGKSGFLTGLSVVMIPVLSFFLLGIRPKVNAWSGVVLAVIGLYLLALADFSQINRGDLLAILCAAGFGLQVAYTAKYAPRADALPLVTIQVTGVAVASLLLSIVFEPWNEILRSQPWLNPGLWGAVLVTSFLATVLAYLGQTYFQRYTSPTRVALIFAMEPVFAACTDYWWLGVTLTGWNLLGCVLIFLGMVLAELPGKIVDHRREGNTCAQKPSES